MNINTDWEQSLLGAELSKDAYVKFEDNVELLRPLLEAKGLSLIGILNNPKTGTQGFVAIRDEKYFLVFRGTEKNLIDILIDLSAKLKQSDHGLKHSGFFNAYKSVSEDIQKFIPKNSEVFICGHSLGGALATIAFNQLREKNKIACFTYGAPAIGDKEFVIDDQSDFITRFVNHGDIVPRALKLAPAITALAPFVLFKPVKLILEIFKMDTSFFPRWKEFLKDLQGDLVKYKQPIPGVLFNGDGTFRSIGDEGLSEETFIGVLFNNKNEVFEDHGIQNYCDEIKRLLSS